MRGITSSIVTKFSASSVVAEFSVFPGRARFQGDFVCGCIHKHTPHTHAHTHSLVHGTVIDSKGMPPHSRIHTYKYMSTHAHALTVVRCSQAPLSFALLTHAHTDGRRNKGMGRSETGVYAFAGQARSDVDVAPSDCCHFAWPDWSSIRSPIVANFALRMLVSPRVYWLDC